MAGQMLYETFEKRFVGLGSPDGAGEVYLHEIINLDPDLKDRELKRVPFGGLSSLRRIPHL